MPHHDTVLRTIARLGAGVFMVVLSGCRSDLAFSAERRTFAIVALPEVRRREDGP